MYMFVCMFMRVHVCMSRAFYFLVPVPSEVSEEEAVDILAREYGVLLMPGGAFGAPGHL